MFLLRSCMHELLLGLIFIIGWSVGFNVGAIWIKGGDNFGRKRGWVWTKDMNGFGRCL